MKQKAYSEYRSAKKIWLGELPSHWKVKRIKHTTYVKGRIGWQGLKTDEFIDEGPYLVTGTDFVNGRINWDTCYHVSEERYNEDPFIQLRDNDLLITKDGTIGKVAIVKNLPGKASLNSGVFVTRPTTNNYLTEFLYWVLNSNVFTGFIDYFKTGTTISHLYQKVFIEFAFPVPTIDEQRAITSFLDRETNHIDTLILKKERQIELLQERRAALISNAVTKGLNPNVKMKDSGVEWLGEIPDHWRLIRLRFVALINPVKSEVSNLPPDTEVSFIPMEAVSEFCGLLLDQTRAIEDVYNGYTYFRNGDIVIAKITPCFENGKGSIAENLTNGVGFGTTELHVVRPGTELDHRFFFYLSISIPFRQPGKAEMYGAGGQKRVPDFFVRNYRIPLPPITEQQQIVRQIDAEWKRIGDLTKEIQESITLLHEYRTALISAAVTGKIDVRNEI